MNNFSLYLTDLARDDIFLSQKFYENQSPNLGNYFYDSIIADLDALEFYGGIHQKHFGFYRMLTKRFPFAIYYELDGEVVIVHAVLHTRKDILSILDRIDR